MSDIVRRKFLGKRSTKGCRTCRARHVKCDEAPGACRNCPATGRTCDGYDEHRLPVRKGWSARGTMVGYGGQMTPDERRGLSYFQNSVIPSLFGFFDCPMWRRFLLQISQTEPAVWHSINMLSAIYYDAKENGMRVSGDDLSNAQHTYALEQATRAFSLLTRRSASSDPELRQVVLLCCFLFVLSELLLGRYDNAFVHLRSGTQLAREFMRQKGLQSPVVRSLLDWFIFLNVQSSHLVGIGRDDEPEVAPGIPTFPATFRNVQETRYTARHIINSTCMFLARCWRLSDSEKMTEYEELWAKRQSFLATFDRFERQFESLSQASYHGMSRQDQRSMEIVRLQYQSQYLALEGCLCAPQDLAALTPKHAAFVSTCERLMGLFPDRPAVTLDIGFIPGLHMVATQCVDFSVRVRAIEALCAWPHCEGILKSNLAVELAVQALEADMQRQGEACFPEPLKDRFQAIVMPW
ncbi:hypothetical protein BO71DRAFT_316251 [Aspergillus ellipticus CBS 707.79]|uniref:Zn(2)-C6 fungal-type domain-containing protein n=1 Tax=Aspergillus ellipticus CBS 707.79 TaxID=1448320 RepID=A0A319F1G3_9EURO|nr:hypothetical protein BO71DRAFT_316251 [Aspergillus ellipticus CBS 707.79]